MTSEDKELMDAAVGEATKMILSVVGGLFAPADPAKIITVAQAASMSGLSKREVRRLCGRRVFRCHRTSKAPNAKYRIVRASFEAYMEKKRWL